MVKYEEEYEEDVEEATRRSLIENNVVEGNLQKLLLALKSPPQW